MLNLVKQTYYILENIHYIICDADIYANIYNKLYLKCIRKELNIKKIIAFCNSGKLDLGPAQPQLSLSFFPLC